MNTVPPSEQDTFKPGSQLRLEVHSGPLAGKGYPFVGDSLTFGRAPDNDIALEDAQVSRYHSVLRRQGNEVIIQDLDSTNGTLVNGERISGPHVLQPTETITVGSSVFSVTGFPAPSTVSMAAQTPADGGWSAYQSSSVRPAVQSGQSSSNWLLWSGVLLLVGLVVAIVAVSVLLFSEGRPGDSEAVRPAVFISSPVAGSSFNIGQRVIVQATATDAEGVVRLELWVAGQKVDEEISPITTGQSPFTAVLEWETQAPGSYSLEVRAINRQGNQSAPTIVNLNVSDDGSVGGSPNDGTPTLASELPQVVIDTDLNVRTGPGTEYDRLGVLASGVTVEVVGKNDDASWWYIVFPPSADERGWVAAQFVTARNTDGVPLINTPTPYPTPSPTSVVEITATFTPTPEPTNTATTQATSTSLPPATPTDTPVPTPTVSTDPTINFSATSTSLKSGECTTFSWLVTNAKAVYFDGQGVAGDNNGQPVTKQECPRETKTYRLRVVRVDDREEIRDIQISVQPKPQAPENLQIVEVLQQGFRLSWRDESSNEDGFRIYDADENDVLLSVDDDETTATVSGLDCNTTYRLYVVAYDSDAGESAPSNIVTEQTLTCP